MKPTLKITLVLAILFFASLSIRVWWLDPGAAVVGDEVDYDILAKQIVAGNGFVDENGNPTAWRTPGFPVFLASIYKIDGTEPSSARIVLAVFSASSTLFVYLFSFFLFKKESIALISSIAWTILPTSIVLAGTLWAENIGTLLLLAAFVMCILPTEKKFFLRAVVTGILIGAAVLTRGYLIFVTLAVPFYLFTSGKSKKTALACLIFSILIPFGWMIRNALALNAFTLSTEAPQVVWLGSNRWTRGSWNGEWLEPNSQQKAHLLGKIPNFFEISEVERSKIYMNESIAEITENPLRFLRLAPKKIAIFLNPTSYLGFDWLYLFCLPFAFAGFLRLLESKEQRHALWLLAFPILCVGSVCVITFGDPRFRYPVDFCFVILASVGIMWAFEKIKVLTTRKNPALPGLAWQVAQSKIFKTLF